MTEKKGLDPNAYKLLAEGEKYQPYVSANESPAEFTIKSIGLGILFGIIFGAANAYLSIGQINTILPDSQKYQTVILSSQSIQMAFRTANFSQLYAIRMK